MRKATKGRQAGQLAQGSRVVRGPGETRNLISASGLRGFYWSIGETKPNPTEGSPQSGRFIQPELPRQDK